MMTPKQRFWLRLVLGGGIVLFLFLFFPFALAFAELAARELRYLWWLILLLLLGIWLIWMANRKIP